MRRVGIMTNKSIRHEVLTKTLKALMKFLILKLVSYFRKRLYNMYSKLSKFFIRNVTNR